MKKIERLANLYLTFLNFPAGMSFAALRRAMPLAYTGDPESARRTFERDKKDLRRLGMELQHFPDGAPLPGGGIARGHTYVPLDPPGKLPESRLSPAESQVLSTLLLQAVALDRALNPGRAARLESAMLKLLYRNPGELIDRGQSPARRPPAQEAESGSAVLARLHAALRHHRLIHFGYASATGELRERAVEPRGLLANRGRWCLVGFCRSARGVRSFYVDRMKGLVVTEVRFRPDPDFRLRDYSLHPLALRLHESVGVTVRTAPGWMEALAEFAGAAAHVPGVSFDRQADTALIRTTNRRGLFQWMLRHPEAIVELGPEPERLEYVRMLSEMIALSSEAGQGRPSA